MTKSYQKKKKFKSASHTLWKFSCWSQNKKAPKTSNKRTNIPSYYYYSHMITYKLRKTPLFALYRVYSRLNISQICQEAIYSPRISNEFLFRIPKNVISTLIIQENKYPITSLKLLFQQTIETLGKVTVLRTFLKYDNIVNIKHQKKKTWKGNGYHQSTLWASPRDLMRVNTLHWSMSQNSINPDTLFAAKRHTCE